MHLDHTMAVLAAASVHSGDGGGGNAPGWPIFVIPPIVFVVALAVVVDPKLPWKLNRRMYRNPDALEPSRAGEWAIRIGALIAIGIAVTLFVTGIKS